MQELDMCTLPPKRKIYGNAMLKTKVSIQTLVLLPQAQPGWLK